MAKDPQNTVELTGILAHPHVIEPHQFVNPRTKKPDGEPKYEASIVMEMTGAEADAVKAIIRRLGEENGADLKTMAKPIKSGTALADARKAKCEAENKAPDGEYQRGKMVLTARSKFPAQLGVLVGNNIIDLDTPEKIKANSGKFYFGTQCASEVSFEWHDKVGGNPAGVHCYLNSLLSFNKGERISGPRPASERFKGFAGRSSSVDPGKNTDDEIPF
jgi:hypothetical protein